MNKSEKPQKNYQKEMEKVIAEIINDKCGTDGSGAAGCLTNDSLFKPALLLHACCGPCSSYVLESLYKYFDITVLYYNPNIYPQEEYQRRFAELQKLYKTFPPALEGKVKVVELDYEPEVFYSAIKVKEEPEIAQEEEKGERCRRCYELRLRCSFEYAKEHGFDYFCTTLSISPFKDAEKINVIGEQLTQNARSCGQKVPHWLPSDFKKKGGFKRSLEISEEYGMYRQEYCGCVYSKNNKKSAIIES